MTDRDLTVAEHAYAVLIKARVQPREVAADFVRELRITTRNTGTRARELEVVQADAWLAICALSKNLDTEAETPYDVWTRAISRTEEWRNKIS
jgi:hypothetical protein